MTTTTTASAVVEDRRRAVERAFRLVYEIQSGEAGAPAALGALSAEARAENWSEVVRACLFGEAVCAWVTEHGDAKASVAELIARAEDADDEVMLALGLALRSDQGFAGGDLLSATGRDSDLARAIVLLDQTSGRPHERISAHTACAIALGNRSLFELSHEQYEAALAVGAEQEPGSVDYLLAPILFNLAEAQLSWACKLRELGDDVGVRERQAAFEGARKATATYVLPPSWELELDAQALLISAIAGDDIADAARALEAGADVDNPRFSALLALAVALSDADAARPGAIASIEAAIERLDPGIHPHPYDLSLFLAATLESRGTYGAALRYARRAADEQWARRVASLGSMQARINAERLASEREMLSRTARLDDLTGIGNRRALEEYLLATSTSETSSIAVALFDLDGFKVVNDRYGHLVGDAVLTRIADMLSAAVRPNDLAVRLGGDEFVIVMDDADTEIAYERAEKLLSCFEESPFGDLGADLVVSMSAGVASGDPAHFAQIIAAADSALYRAKRSGGCLVARSDR